MSFDGSQMVRKWLTAVAAGIGVCLSCASGARANPYPQTPYDMAVALERELAAGMGILIPDPDTPYLRDYGTLPLFPDEWLGFPRDFLNGLVGVQEHGVTVYPVAVQVDDASGWTMFRNAAGMDFWTVAPGVAYSPDWIFQRWYGGQASALDYSFMASLLLPSHVVAQWVFVDGQDIALYKTAQNTAQNTRQARQPAGPTRQLSPSEPDMKITAFNVGTNAFHFTVEWNDLMEFPLGLINLWYTQSLSEPEWCIIHTVEGIIAGTAGSTNIDLLFEDMPYSWWCPFGHQPDCTPVTNIVTEITPPYEVYTNVTCNCHLPEAPSPTGFFKVDILGSGGGGWWDDDDILIYDPPEDFDNGVDTGNAQWVILTGDLDVNVHKRLTTELTIKSGQTYALVVYIHSDEYPEWTADHSRYNDRLGWRIIGNTGATTLAADDISVNDRHEEWEIAEQNNVSVQGFYPAHLETLNLFTAPWDKKGPGDPNTGETTVSVSLSVVNVGDEKLPSTVIVGMLPLKLVQKNMPNVGIPFNSTDMGVPRVQKEIGLNSTNSIAYITGQPAPPQLEAWLEGAPDHIQVTWKMSIVTERPERGILDNRNYQEVTLPGGTHWNITQAMDNEIVGGKCTLTYTVKYAHGEVAGQKSGTFYIRGKNPKDDDVKAYINQVTDPALLRIAHHIALIESKQTEGVENNKTIWRIFNQFNAGDYTNRQTKEVTPAGTPNRSSDTKGWGIGQITTLPIPTAIVWNWKANIDRLASLLNNDKWNEHETYIKSQKRWCEKYGFTWVEPPVTYAHPTKLDLELTCLEWGVLVLYNGAGGITGSKGIDRYGKETEVQSPWSFDPNKRTWTLHDNSKGYIHKVTKALNQMDNNEIKPKE